MRTHLYEGMFLVDNERVREDWKKTKSVVTDFIAKHGGTVETARRWDERRLAYPIERRQRGTFVLAFFSIDTQHVSVLRRDLELSETVLRYLIRHVDVIPEGEQALSAAELADGFVLPPPPEDEVLVEEEAPEGRDRGPRGSHGPQGTEDDGDTGDDVDDLDEAEVPAGAGATSEED